MKPKFKRFNEIKAEDLNFDFHIHTNQTDGLSSPEEIIDKAIRLKLKAIAFTEHINKTSNWFNDFKKKINSFKKNKKIKIFLGIEAKVIDHNGTLDATDEMIKESDIVIGVVHRYPDGKGGFMALNEIPNLGPDKAAEIEFKAAQGLLKNRNVDILGHPFGVYSMFFTKLPKDCMEKLLIESLKTKIAMEINMKYLIEKDLFFRLLKETNPRVSIGSDAHNTEELARALNIINLIRGSNR